MRVSSVVRGIRQRRIRALPPPGIDMLLIASGPLTAITLFLFAYGARRIPYSTMGLLQYIAPSLQLACGSICRFTNRSSATHAAGFALIWTALIIYAGDGLWRAR
jgi:chloramphenicol-sensitive protein RarD